MTASPRRTNVTDTLGTDRKGQGLPKRHSGRFLPRQPNHTRRKRAEETVSWAKRVVLKVCPKGLQLPHRKLQPFRTHFEDYSLGPAHGFLSTFSSCVVWLPWKKTARVPFREPLTLPICAESIRHIGAAGGSSHPGRSRSIGPDRLPAYR